MVYLKQLNFSIDSRSTFASRSLLGNLDASGRAQNKFHVVWLAKFLLPARFIISARKWV